MSQDTTFGATREALATGKLAFGSRAQVTADSDVAVEADAAQLHWPLDLL